MLPKRFSPWIFALSFAACGGRQAATAASPVTRPAAPADVPAAADVADASGVRAAPEPVPPHGCLPGARARREGERVFHVADGEGVREVGADGAVLRVLSPTAAGRPRYTRDRAALLFLAPGRAELRRVELSDCRESLVARLPRGVGANCGGGFPEDYDPTEFVQEDGDARLTPDGAALCLQVLDRNINMMSVALHLRVPLDGGEVTHRMVSSEGCGEAVGPAYDALPCAPAFAASRTPPPVTPPPAHPFSLRDNAIVRGGRVAARLGGEVSQGATSPSGRWVVLAVNRSEGDYIYRDLLLLDRATGRVSLVAPAPRALTADELRDPQRVHERTASAAGETTVRFTGDGDALLVDTSLVEPGRGMVPLGGAVAE